MSSQGPSEAYVSRSGEISGFDLGSHKPRGWYLWPQWARGRKRPGAQKNFKPVFGVRDPSGWLRAEKLVWLKILGAREATGGAENSKNGSRKWSRSSLVPRDQFFSTSRPMSAGPRPGPGPSVATTQSGCAVWGRVRVQAVRGNSGATGVLSEGPGPTPKNATPPLRGDNMGSKPYDVKVGRIGPWGPLGQLLVTI